MRYRIVCVKVEKTIDILNIRDITLKVEKEEIA